MRQKQGLTEAQESSIDQYLKTIGLNPVRNPDEAGGSGDRIVGGESTEYKTISGLKNENSDTISAAIANRAMNARSQAPHVVIDARSLAGMSELIAERGAKRAFGADKVTAANAERPTKLASVRILFRDGLSERDILRRPPE